MEGILFERIIYCLLTIYYLKIKILRKQNIVHYITRCLTNICTFRDALTRVETLINVFAEPYKYSQQDINDRQLLAYT